MISVRSFFILFVAALACCASAGATETTLRRADLGVLGAMKRMHCRPQWLSVVMRGSGILESDLGGLRPGTPIHLPEGCENMPARADSRASSNIVVQELASVRVKRAEQANGTLRAELRRKTEELNIANNETIPALREEVRLANVRADTIERSEALWQWKIIGISVIVGIIVALLGMLPFILRLKKEIGALEDAKIHDWQELLPLDARRGLHPNRESGGSSFISSLPSAIEFHDKVERFRDTSTYSLGCPYCSERQIKPTLQNMRQHLEKHAFLRAVEKDPEEIRAMLASAAS